MDSEWYSTWVLVWLEIWESIFYHIMGYTLAVIALDAENQRYHRDVLAGMIETAADEIVALIEHVTASITDPFTDWANQFVIEFEAWLLSLLGIEVEPDAPAEEHIANLWTSIIALWARFGYEITKSDVTVVGWVQAKLGLTDLEVADTFYTVKGWVQTRLSLVWDSIVAIWARFGPTFLEGDWTVETWVEDKVTAVTQWVLDNYEAARLQAEAAALWIAIHGQVLVDWLTDNGQNLVDWYDTYATYYKDLYDNYHDLLLEFLEDPGAFIGKYVDPYVVIDPGEEDPNWLLALLAFLLNPIGWLLVQFAKWHGLIADWILAWLNDNFPSLEEVLAAIPPPDLGLPTVEDWLNGLREPETDEEKAYVALLDTKLQQILDDTLGDNPLTATEFSSLFFNAPGGSET